MNPELPLRDIRPALEAPWWPPAPGWWFLAAALLFLVALAGWKALVRYRRARRRARLLAEYRRLADQAPAVPLLLAAAGAFLKRLLIHELGRRDVAPLAGNAWARTLSEPFPEEASLREAAELLAEAPYLPPEADRLPRQPRALLDALVHRWVEHATGGGSR